jgi:hypothetical protein
MMQNPLQEELKFAYEMFLHQATEKGFAFSGMMMRIDPPAVLVIGNVKESGHALASLFRQFADTVDNAESAGNIERPEGI